MRGGVADSGVESSGVSVRFRLVGWGSFFLLEGGEEGPACAFCIWAGETKEGAEGYTAADMMMRGTREVIRCNKDHGWQQPSLAHEGEQTETGLRTAPDLFKIFSITPLLRFGCRPTAVSVPSGHRPLLPLACHLHFPMSIRSMLALLAARIGAAQAEQEYKWLKQAVPRVSDLVTMIRRRTLGEPLQYILGTSFTPIYLPKYSDPALNSSGSQPFGPLNLLTRAPVLIPRPETEHWVIKLSQHISPPAQSPHRLLDLGTGTGCIPLLLCHLSPPGSIHATGVDISDHAIQLARENAANCGIAAPPHGTHNTFKVIKANILDVNFHHHPGISLPIDILTSNPPYITWQDYLKLPYSVSAFEDPKALFGGPSGLEFYRAIARFISLDGCLSPGALVALEVGHGQARNVEDLLQKTGRMKRTEIWPDPWGKERTVVGHTT